MNHPKRHTGQKRLITTPIDLLVSFKRILGRRIIPENLDGKLILWSDIWSILNRRHPELKNDPQYANALLASTELCNIDWKDPQIHRRMNALSFNNTFARLQATIDCAQITIPEFGNPIHCHVQKILGEYA